LIRSLASSLSFTKDKVLPAESLSFRPEHFLMASPNGQSKSKDGNARHAYVLKALSCALEKMEDAYLSIVYNMLDENSELTFMSSCVLVMLMFHERSLLFGI
jgi:hypothetical protein